MGRSQRKERSSERNTRTPRRHEAYAGNVVPFNQHEEHVKPKVLVGKNQEQNSYINTIKNNVITVAIGPAGSGKTFIPAVLAAQELTNPRSDFKSIILVRPNEPLGNSLGMLPGTLAEKLEPWLVPIADGVKYAIGETAYKGYLEREKIQFLAVEHLRGRTFNNAFVIVDEAQNISIEAMKCLVTRVGMDCRLVICGDIAQQDIRGNSGLGLLMEIYDKYEYSPFQIAALRENVRSRESAAFQSIFDDMEKPV